MLLGHPDSNVSLLHESQREIALVEALSRPIPDYQQGEVGQKDGPFVHKVCASDVSLVFRTARFESVSESQPIRLIHYNATKFMTAWQL